jgi:hypothetical protein
VTFPSFGEPFFNTTCRSNQKRRLRHLVFLTTENLTPDITELDVDGRVVKIDWGNREQIQNY